MTQTESQTGFAKIAVGVDFSPSSQHALDTARARFPGAQIRLLHVTDARVTTSPDLMGGVTPAVFDAGLLNSLEDSDARRLGALMGENEETEQLVGDPVTGIVEAAARWGADLIVVGTHSQGALEHFFIGSSAEKIVGRSLIPVLTVRLPEGRS